MPEPVSSNQEERNIRQQKNPRTNAMSCTVGSRRNCPNARDTYPFPSTKPMNEKARAYETSRPGGIDMNASCNNSCTYDRAKTNFS